MLHNSPQEVAAGRAFTQFCLKNRTGKWQKWIFQLIKAIAICQRLADKGQGSVLSTFADKRLEVDPPKCTTM